MKVVRSDGTGVGGYLLARNPSTLTLICAGEDRSLLTLRDADVVQVSFQKERPIEELPGRDCQPIPVKDAQAPPADEPKPTTTTKTTTITTPAPPPRPTPLAPTRTVIIEKSITTPAQVTTVITPGPTRTVTLGGGRTPSPARSSPRVHIPSGQRTVPRTDGRYLVKLGTFREAVTGEASLLLSRPGQRSLRAATKSFQAGKSNSAVAIFGLSPAAKRLVESGTAIRARLVVTVRGSSGLAVRRTVSLILARQR